MATELNTQQQESLKNHNWFKKLKQELALWVNSNRQQLFLIQGQMVLKSWFCSTGKAGMGEKSNSFKTPRGWHEIAEKIGDQMEAGSVFSSRKFTGKVWSEVEHNNNDLILSRILWLRGLEEGKNKGEGIDSYSRYIYIHGSNHIKKLGKKASFGCVRMHPKEVITLFDLIEEGTKILIT